MDVPFVASRATSRAHYALVRKVESAPSVQSANQYLYDEVMSIRHQLAQPSLSLERCKECLIILLYCHMTLKREVLPRDALDFALAHAINLAEAGRTTTQKRIGYLYCAQVMPINHELQLMLVNTLCKDLGHENIPRICLALDNIIASSNEDLVPAIYPQLHNLLSHNSAHVRRRALLAVHSLSRHYPGIFTRFSRQIMERLEDPDMSVVAAALISSLHISNRSSTDMQIAINNLFKAASANISRQKPRFLLTAIHALTQIGLSEENIPAVLALIHLSSKSKNISILRGAFSLLSKVTPQTLLSCVPLRHNSPINDIRLLLASRDPNDVYIFLSCLEGMDPVIWAGTSPDTPAVLESWEVEQIMRLLDSTDPLIRRKTLMILNRVDSGIITSYYSRALQAIPRSLSTEDSNELALRLLEVLEIQSGEDGEVYANEVQNLLARLEGASRSSPLVLETAVEMILVRMHSAANSSFRLGCATTLISFVATSERQLPQSIVVIAAALAIEFCCQLSMSPIDNLKGFLTRLPSCASPVQSACLLAMLRIGAECSEVPLEIVDAVRELGQRSGRHIRMRCEQFTTLIHQRSALNRIISRARSSSLPDFLAALQDEGTKGASQPSSTPWKLTVASQLRSKPYDTPSAAPRLRTRPESNSRYDIENSHSGTFGGESESASRASLRLSVASRSPPPRTLTPGQLALVAGSHELELMNRMKSDIGSPPKDLIVDESDNRADLIAFESPSTSDPEKAYDMIDFTNTWNSNEQRDMRGWQKGSIENVIRRLQKLSSVDLRVISANVEPFLGDLKVIIWVAGKDLGVVRLRGSDEDSYLWRLRLESSNEGLGERLRKVFQDEL